MERPQWSAIHGVLEELNKSLDNAAQTRQKIVEITGTAWSEDRLIKAVVGPRGQLVDLDIDPRVYRTPNSKALSATILSTVRAAVEDASRQTREILAKAVPSGKGLGVSNKTTIERMMDSHDADLPSVLREGDDGYVR
jgi:DNA-binding protein YbaB